MTKNQRFYVEQIVNYLNLLHEENIFKIEYEDWKENSILNGVKISTTSTAFRNELAMLVYLLHEMTICSYDLPMTIELH